MQETVPDFFRDVYHLFITKHVSKWWMQLQYRFNPKHKYHLVDTGLTPGYYEIDERMIHAMFSLLVSFVEREHQFNNPEEDWNHWPSLIERSEQIINGDIADESGADERPWAQAMIKVNQLYCWWTKIRITREEIRGDYPEDFDFTMFLDHEEELKDHPHYPLFKQCCSQGELNVELRELWRKIDTERMKELVEIRGFLYT